MGRSGDRAPLGGSAGCPASVRRMTLAVTERAALCDLLLELGPDADTLCDGWLAADLAAHCWTRERDPLSLVGVPGGPLAAVTDARMRRALDRSGFEGLVADLRTPAPWSPFAVPAIDAAANGIEYFVHHEDLRRGGDPAGTPPLRRSPADEDELWRRLGAMAPALLRRSPVGIIAERTDAPVGSGRRRLIAKPGPDVLVRGAPGELVLFAFGRRTAAEVEVTGPVDAVEAVLAARFGF